MNPQLKDFIKRWLINTVAVLVATYLVRGISYDSDNLLGLLLATLVLGILNTFLRPILLLLSLPLVIVTLGLFTIVINALLLFLVGQLFDNFQVASFGAALFGAVIISVVSFFLNILTGTNRARIQVSTSRSKSSRKGSDKDDDDGPVIDV